MTYFERAERLYATYGRVTASGRVFLRDEYIGVIDRARGTARAKGMCRGLVLVTANPIDVVARWLL